MKKNLLLLSAIWLLAGAVFPQNAQDGFDAVRLSQTTQLSGTSRYISMGGAFTALGQDVSAINQNPAGLGLYKYMEISVTGDYQSQIDNFSWNLSRTKEKNTAFHLNNFALVLSNSKNRRLHSAFGLSYNRLQSFYRSGTTTGASQLSSLTDFIAYRTTEAGYTENSLRTRDGYDPLAEGVSVLSVWGYNSNLINPQINPSTGTTNWKSLLLNNETITPTYTFCEQGYADRYSIAYGLNIQNELCMGISLGLRDIKYSKSSDYSEAFSGNGDLMLRNTLSTSGLCADLKFGFIFLPFNFLRVGISYHSPTFYFLQDEYSSSLFYDISFNGNPQSNTFSLPVEKEKYRIQTGSTYTAGLAFLIRKSAIFSFDFQYEGFRDMRLYDAEGFTQVYTDVNKDINNDFNGVYTIRFGAEYKPVSTFSMRFGYNYITSATQPSAYRWRKTNTTRMDNDYFLDSSSSGFTGGIGWQSSHWNIDFAFISGSKKQALYTYADENLVPASLKTNNTQLYLTVGFKFNKDSD